MKIGRAMALDTYCLGLLAAVLLVAVLLSSGCATVRTAWHDLTGTPVAAAAKADRKVEQRAAQVDTARSALVGDAHTKVVLAEILARYVAEQSRTADSGCAPANPSTGWPSLNSTTVGRLRIPKRATMSCSASQSTLASSNWP